jgi:hypothetical protein
MSTDPYPEVSVDESGIVPPQSARPPEWPKKLRTLTAAELDRLTIDSSGRFYWDGKLVDYGTGANPAPDRTSESLTRSLDILDRASYDLRGRKDLTTIEGQLAEPAGSSAEPDAVDLDVIRAEAVAAATAALADAPQVIRSDRTHFKLSRWQAIGAVIVVVAIAIGAFGMATYGYVAARDWGCKTGTFKDGCPTPDVVKPTPRSDIPA